MRISARLHPQVTLRDALSSPQIMSGRRRLLLRERRETFKSLALLSPPKNPYSLEVRRPTLFLFLWQATPSCGTAFFYFSTAAAEAGGLGFDAEFLGRASAAGSVAGLAGVGAYNAFYKQSPLSQVILATSVASAIIGCAHGTPARVKTYREYPQGKTDAL